MQTVIVVLVVAAAAVFMARRFYNNVKKGGQPTCDCGCDGCSPEQKDNCTEIKE